MRAPSNARVPVARPGRALRAPRPPRRLIALAAGCGVIALAPLPLHAQGGILGKIKQKAEQAVEREVTRTPAQKPDSTAQRTSTSPGVLGAPAARPGEGVWANYDFRPGERILYADDFTGDVVGDFPRRLEFRKGAMEIVESQGTRWLRASSSSEFTIPLRETLPRRFTLEFDVVTPGEVRVFPEGSTSSRRYFVFSNGTRVGLRAPDRPQTMTNWIEPMRHRMYRARVMVDGPYVKLYVDSQRMVNAPNFDTEHADRIAFTVDGDPQHPAMLGNFRLAAGGRKLYDVLADSGRVATQGIRFEFASDRVRPESTPALREIAAMLAEHPGLRLVIEGHTDDVGKADENQRLSERRAAAVRAALARDFGVDSTRLTSAGFGATRPAAPNTTAEGRQQNRRVELVRQ